MSFLSGIETNGSFYFQDIIFSNQINHRVLQNENGPCPLLALVNAMLLRRKFTMRTGSLSGKFPISFKQLTDCLSRELDTISQRYLSEDNDTKIIQITQCFELFPTLEKGLDINIKFNDVQSFDMRELAHQFFEIYDLNIYHCWVIDPDGIFSKIYHLIADKTYDQVQDMLIQYQTEDSSKQTKDETIELLIQNFLSRTSQQRTKYGVHKLYKSMKPNEIGTLFHNNHYSTIYKHGDDHVIYELVTDEGIADDTESIVWKTFNPSVFIVGIDEIFVDSNFNAVNENGKRQLDKLRTIINHLRKYKYDITHEYVNINGANEDEKEQNLVVKKLENAIEFVTKFPLNPLQCKPVFETKKVNMCAKDDLADLDAHLQTLQAGPQPMTRALSDTITNSIGSIVPHKEHRNGSESEHRYNIRQCRVEDVQCICNELNFKDERFWAKEFLTDNTNRNGYVLEDDKSNIIGFILYERCEPLINSRVPRPSSTALSTTPQILLRDLSATVSKETELDCKWRVSDWKSNTKNQKNKKKISFYSQFILITNIMIHTKYRKKGYGSKLLQTIIYSFESGTPFAARITFGNDSAVHCFGKCGFVISRNERDTFYMTLVSDYDRGEVSEFKKLSTLKETDTKAEIIKELKESKNMIRYGSNSDTEDAKDEKDEKGDEEIFIKQEPIQLSKDDEKKMPLSDDSDGDIDFEETKEEEFDFEKLNRLLAELCCMEDKSLVGCLLKIIMRFLNNQFERVDIEHIKRDFDMALQPTIFDAFKSIDMGMGTGMGSAIDDEKEREIKNKERIKLAFEVLYCAGFVRRRFGNGDSECDREDMKRDCISDNTDSECDEFDFYDNDNDSGHRFYLAFESDDLWRLEAVNEMIIKYSEATTQKQQRTEMLKSITFDMDPAKYWKHIFSSEAHGKDIRDITIRLLKKVCKGIVSHANDLQHRGRNLNYETLQDKFHCQMPLLLLQKYGFEQRVNLLQNQTRLVYTHRDVTRIQTMLAKIEFEEKLMRDADIFSEMSPNMQTMWYHTLSDVHGKKVQQTTVDTLKKICTAIVSNPYDTHARKLNMYKLKNLFHCQIPIKLLGSNGWMGVRDWSGEWLRYDASDITPVKNMLAILERAGNIDLSQAMSNRGGMAVNADQLRLLLALNKASQMMHGNDGSMGGSGDPRAQLLNALLDPFGGGSGNNALTLGTDSGGLQMDNNDNSLDFGMTQMSPLFNPNRMGNSGNNNNMFSANGMDTDIVKKMDGDSQMSYMQIGQFLGSIHSNLKQYRGAFHKNGIRTKNKLLNMDPGLVDFLVDNPTDGSALKDWLQKMNNSSSISGI